MRIRQKHYQSHPAGWLFRLLGALKTADWALVGSEIKKTVAG
jgi:hypothetical protein